MVVNINRLGYEGSLAAEMKSLVMFAWIRRMAKFND